MTKVKRREFLRRTVGGSLVLSASVARPFSSKRLRPPNFVFLCADDLGWGDLRCYGNTYAITPHLDQLAQQGIRFTQFYVNSPVCSPTRAAFITGRFPAHFALHGHLATPELNAKRGMPDSLDPTSVTIAKLLKEAGYVTGHFGKWHMGVIEAKEYGFDEYKTVAGGGSNQWKWDKEFTRHSSEFIVDEALRFIESHRGEPFFVNVWFTHPHAPLDPTDEQLRPYAERIDKRLTPGRYFTPQQIYYAVVTEMDRQIGRLLSKLDELGLTENTVVMFTSDNGPEDMAILEAAHSGVGSTGPFRGRKRSLYEGGIRVPFIVRYPAQTPARCVDRETVLSGVDLLPTICQLAGVKVPSELPLDGEDMSPAFLGQPKRRTKPLMWEWRFRIFGHPINRSPILAIREGDWKLLLNPDRRRVELYHLPTDPMEVNNRATEEPTIVERLAEQVLAWQATLPKGPMDPDAGSNAYPFPP